MALNVDGLVSAMSSAGQGLAGEVWSQMKNFAIPEFKKIGIQIVEIAENIGDYTPKGAKALLDLQVTASIGVIVAMTTLTMLAVQQAINAILGAIRDMVNGGLPFPLL